ncbi:unnamed protein product, partial [Didymodactylos carnosus]
YDGSRGSKARRELFAEFERQRHLLAQFKNLIDHQQVERLVELRRQRLHVRNDAKRIHRSSNVALQRARIRNLLDINAGDTREPLYENSFSSFQHESLDAGKVNDKRKRTVYHCRLPILKPNVPTAREIFQSKQQQQAALNAIKRFRSTKRWSVLETQFQPMDGRISFGFPTKGMENLQQKRIDNIVNSCISNLEECNMETSGYEHFRFVVDATRNASLLSQQNVDVGNQEH